MPVVSKLNRDSLDSKRNPEETSSVGGKAKHTLAYTGDDTNLASPAPLSLLAWPKWLDFPGLSFCIRETRGLNRLLVKGSSSSKTRFFQQRVRRTVTVWVVFQYGYNNTSHPFVPMPFPTLKVRLSFPIP